MEQVDENDKQSTKSHLVSIRYTGVPADTIKESNTGINVTPFNWIYYNQVFPMKFISGFAGATMTEDGYIMPQLGWGVVNNGPERTVSPSSQPIGGKYKDLQQD